MVSRAQRTRFSEWWWTVDKILLAGLIALMFGGIVLSLAASPAVAERLGYDDSFHFVKRHLFFFLPALAVMIATSFLTPRQVRRTAFIMLGVMLVLLMATLFVGVEVKGARRWIDIAGISIQPSEFMKPAFVVVVAWLFSESKRRTDIPTNLFALILLAVVVSLLVAEPDFGQTMLVAAAWGALFFMAGVPWIWIAGLGAAAAGGIVAAYAALPHVAGRIDRFISPASGDTFQIDTALESILRGGWLGQGPGEGTVKRILPDAHTDFIFAVAAEEFGIIVCIALVAVFGLVVIRGLSRSLKTEDSFTRLAAGGLVVLFGVQSLINMAVNLKLIPAKGMTLPFISYGGSSMIAVAFGMGLLLALTRRRPETLRITPRIAAEVAADEAPAPA
ncbi:MAG TPA: putative lipid II flippase FtsW [Bauldia sp.]|nr:putative lipid II flippase FtsW [Bauldia sp.]